VKVELKTKYIHIDDRKIYIPISYCSFKDSIDGDFVLSVIYECADGDGKLYVKSVNDFLENFKRIDDEN